MNQTRPCLAPDTPIGEMQEQRTSGPVNALQIAIPPEASRKWHKIFTSKDQRSMAHSILVVDDDPHIRDVVRFAFEKTGMAISIAQDGKEALRQFDRNVHEQIGRA